MANGILGNDTVPVGTYGVVYTVPALVYGQVAINMTNRGSSRVKIRLALSASDVPTNAEFLFYDTEILPNSTIEKKGIFLDTNKRVIVQCDQVDVGDPTPNVNVTVYGTEVSTT